MHVDPQAESENDDPSYEAETETEPGNLAENGYDPYDDDEVDDPYDDAPATDAAEQLRSLVLYLATNLVDDPESVEAEARQRGGSVFISLRVPEDELGKVIGRGGRIARAMRTALMISGSRNGIRASLDIED
jgi:predicted RNA-binding protein YlqC (UPF0109 family)